jgi:hypothetical protein
VANKNTSEPDTSSNRSRGRATAKPAAPRRPATTAAPSQVQLSSDGAAQIDTAADMSGTASADQGNPGYDEIAEAAYHRFLRRGGQDGGDVDDWVEAERDLRERGSR